MAPPNMKPHFSVRRDPSMPEVPPDAHLDRFSDILPGRGNLDLRMLFASQIGPFRVAHGMQRAAHVSELQPTQIALNNPQGSHPMFVQVSLPSTVLGPIMMLFSKNVVLDAGQSIPVNLNNNPGQIHVFRAVLEPSDELYAQCDGAVVGGVNVAISLVSF